MSWLGLGVVSNLSTALLQGGVAEGVPPLLAPSAAWDGSEGSGFSAIPSDPERLSAKPALQLITPPKQHFTDTLDVGVFAAANDGGSLHDALGLSGVTFHLEGSSVTLDAPSLHSFVDVNGQPQTYFGWWVRLRKPPQSSGYAHLYVEATPRDATMQSRVIGPYLFAPQNDLYDGQLSVAPGVPESSGSTYQSIVAAIDHAKSQGWENYLVTLAEPGKYDIGDSTPTRWDQKGWCNIRAGVPGCSIGKDGYIDDANAKIVPARSPIRLMGSDLTLDFRHVVEIDSFNGNFWCDGITITSTDPLGRYEMLRGGPPDHFGWRIDGNPYFTECDISELSGVCGQATLVRGCTLTNMTYDVFGDVTCAVFNRLTNHRGGFWYRDHPCVEISYSGTEATATIERDGTADAGIALWTARWGANSATFECGNQEEYFLGLVGDGYTFQDLLDWVNNDLAALDSGWSATLTDPSFANIRCCAGSIVDGKGTGFDPQDVLTTPLTIAAMFDRHGDFYQHATGTLENAIIAFNTGVDVQAQLIFISPTAAGGIAAERDLMVLGNAFYIRPGVDGYYDPEANSSQFGRTNLAASHVVIAHNTHANQRWLLRSDNPGFTADPYCLFANNIASALVYAGSPLPDLTIDAIHLHDGSTKPSGATRVAFGGNASSLFVDPAAGDFTPTPDLLASGFEPILPSDISGSQFPALSAPGAIAIEATAFTESTGGSGSTDPEGDLIALISAAGGQSGFHDYTTAANGSPWVSSDRSTAGNDHRQSVNSRKPSVDLAGAIFDGNNDFVLQAIAGGTFTIAMAVTVNDPADPGVFISDDANTTYVQYQSGSGVAHQATVRVNGEVRATRGEVHNAVNGAGEVIMLMEGLDLSGRSQIRIGRGSGTMNATVRRVAVIEEGAFPGNLQLVRQLAADAVAES
ncbi:hypothetical protein [uncultured Erythrobacter sp.]|uniref:hypothetical protein n=1 Tax=uncultured Erythrobacter sp. TaxID=263913 RepID=UPI00260A5C5E|nr:hypothetical protein [uncultured Erythrobacter sp.]